MRIIYIINHHLFIISEEECKCAQVRKHKAAHDKNNIIPRKIKNMHQKRNASAQVCKHKAAHDLKKMILLTQLFIINIQIRKAEGSCTMLEV